MPNKPTGPEGVWFTLELTSPHLVPGDRVQLHILGAATEDCAYDARTGRWTCTLPLRDHPDGLTFVFRLDGSDHLAGPVTLTRGQLADPEACRFDGHTVQFARQHAIVVDVPAVAARFLPTNTDERRRYDVIVVGSGAGGGTLAHQLSSASWRGGGPPRVLLLEAGSYLFPTHTGNLPRHEPVRGGEYHPMLFEGWRTFGLRRWRAQDAESSRAQIAQGVNFGGRTVFWGACSPRLRQWELREWPRTVATELHDVWYERAEQLMRVAPQPSSAYQSTVKAALRKLPLLEDFDHADAPMAIEYTAPVGGALPSGIWSAAELLLHRALHKDRFGSLQINLNHEVVQVETTGGRATGVVTYDHVAGRDRTYRLADDGVVVLAAGTVGTANIAKLSGLADPVGLIGAGITDHPIYVVKFWVPRDSDWHTRFDSSKTLSRCRAAAFDTAIPAQPFNVMLELGANLNQSRFVSPAAFTGDNIATFDGKMPGELVFLAESPLVEDNVLIQDSRRAPDIEPATLPTIRIHPSPVAAGLAGTFDKIAAEVVPAFGGQIQEQLWAPLGGVSHEVGTLRMRRVRDGRERPGVVTDNLRLQGYDNLYACDLSVFPSSPASNPSLTLVSLAMRLAHHLSG
jgi:choline dehydrogenase-like flavoprotein